MEARGLGGVLHLVHRVGPFEVTLDGPPGARAGAVFAAGRAVATKVFLRVNGEWRLWQHHASPVVDRPARADRDEAPP